MKEINGGNIPILRALPDQIDYLRGKCDILAEGLVEKTGKPQPEFSEPQKRRLNNS